MFFKIFSFCAQGALAAKNNLVSRNSLVSSGESDNKKPPLFWTKWELEIYFPLKLLRNYVTVPRSIFEISYFSNNSYLGFFNLFLQNTFWTRESLRGPAITEERLPSFEVFVLLKIFLGSWFCWFIFRIIHFHGYFASLIDWRSSFSLILAYFRICWDFSAKADPSHYFQKCRSLGGTKISFNDVLEPKAADGPFSWHCWDAAAVTGNNFKTKLFHFLIYSKGEVSNFDNCDSSSS